MSSAGALAPAIFSLTGVALGVLGSTIGVWYTQRVAREKARIDFESTLRTERKEVYLQFLETVQDCWFFLLQRWEGGAYISREGKTLAEDEVQREEAELNRDLWYRLHKLNLVAPSEVRSTALTLAQKIERALHHPERIAETSFWRYLNPSQDEFLTQTRRDLGTRERSHG